MMIDPNYRNRRRTYGDDKPTRLQSISDADKALAIADAIQEITKRALWVEIDGIEYSTRPWEKGSFRSPVRIDCAVLFDATAVDEKTALELVRQIVDDEWCSSIARNLSARCDEEYLVELFRKRYAPAGRPGTLVEASLLVATTGDIQI